MSATLTDPAAAFSAAGTHADRVAALRLLPARQRVLLAADWAETVLPVWEGAYPADDRPRRAIEAAWAAHAVHAAAHAVHAVHAAAYAAHAAAAYAAQAAAYAAQAAAYAAHAAAHAAHAAAAYAAQAAQAAGQDWSAVRRLWEPAYHASHVWRPEWATPLAVEMARDPAAYPVLLDLLEDQGVPVDGLRAGKWARSNWAVYHLTEGEP